MRALNTAGYFIFLFLFASAPLYAQNWQSIVLQKTKAAQTIKEIKNNVLSSQQTGRQSATRQQQQAQDEFLLTVKQFYPSAAAQQRIMQNYRHIYTRLHALPSLNSYALTVQHPADLYSVSTEEIALLDQVFASFTKQSKEPSPTPYRALQFESGAVVLSFKTNQSQEIHLAFKPQENILKIAVGDFPISQQEFGPFPQELNEK